MKKSILLIGLLMITGLANAQIMTYVEAPSSNEGSYDFTYADPGSGWGVGDLADPGEAVSGTMVMVDAGGAADSLACGTLVNGGAINGNIAVCYRGSCEFGTKAWNAQQAGAIAVIIINNTGGAPLEMGGGSDGTNVTVPVVMITNDAGALLKQEIEAGNSTVFIGTKVGLFGDDLSIQRSETLRAQSFGVPGPLAQDGTEFNFEVGAWIRNYGNNNQTGVQLNCTVTISGSPSPIYDETSTAVDIDSGDSAFVTLPTFQETSYANGLYEMTYSIVMGTTDESSFDNTWDADFLISDSLFSTATIDETTLKPVANYAQFNGEEGDGTWTYNCIHFKDPNASRLGIYGMTVSAFTSQNPDPTSLDGKYFEIFAYQWDDQFDSIGNTVFPDDWYALDLSNPPIAQQQYIYIDNLQGTNLFLEFDEHPILIDDQRYLFCMYTDAGLYQGFDNTVDYNLNYALYDQPVSVVNAQNTAGDYIWFPAGNGADRQPAMTLNLYPEAQASILENVQDPSLTAFPNPANEFVNVILKENYGEVAVVITDIQGKVVNTQDVSMDDNILVLDVTSLASGSYIVNLKYDGDQEQSFKVAVTR